MPAPPEALLAEVPRRPSANADPYELSRVMMATTLALWD